VRRDVADAPSGAQRWLLPLVVGQSLEQPGKGHWQHYLFEWGDCSVGRRLVVACRGECIELLACLAEWNADLPKLTCAIAGATLCPQSAGSMDRANGSPKGWREMSPRVRARIGGAHIRELPFTFSVGDDA
jgi:hypothetical protein